MATMIAGKPAKAAQPQNGAARQQIAAVAFCTQPQDDNLFYGSLQHGEFRLREALRLDLSAHGSDVVVEWQEAKITAKGQTLGEALSRFRNTVIEEARLGANNAVVRVVERDTK